MNSQQWSDPQQYRNKCVAEIMELCLQLGLDSTATEKKLTIRLPDVENIKAIAERKKSFDISKWGPVGIDETDPMPDDFQMPEYGEKLDEGEPPVGDKEAEK